MEVVNATSETFNEPNPFIFAYIFILARSSSGYVQISQRKLKSGCIRLELKNFSLKRRSAISRMIQLSENLS